jgi:streptomycin 6-kinase
MEIGSPFEFAVPDVVANRARSVGAQHWLDGLPALMSDLAREWNLELCGPAYSGGTEAMVVAVRAEATRPAVLKLLVPRERARPREDDVDGASNEITVLRLAGGVGCAALYRADGDRGALLLERLGPSLFDLGLPLDERHRIQCRTAARVWRPVPASVELPTGAEKARWLIEYIERAWEELDRPCSSAAVDHALAAAHRRLEAHDPALSALVHGDVNDWNVLRDPEADPSGGDGYKLVDPDGLLAQPEYDLGVIMREDPIELLDEPDPMDRARRLAAWASEYTAYSLDPAAVWEWGLVERVSTGLMATRIDLQPIGRQMLLAADRLAGIAS